MVFNDFIAPVPDLTGRWKFTIYYENTANTKFQGLAVTYQVLMIQDGFNLSGHGEKISERGPTQKALDYVGAQRTSIEVIGRESLVAFSWGRSGVSVQRGRSETGDLDDPKTGSMQPRRTEWVFSDYHSRHIGTGSVATCLQSRRQV